MYYFVFLLLMINLVSASSLICADGLVYRDNPVIKKFNEFEECKVTTKDEFKNAAGNLFCAILEAPGLK